MCFADTLLNIQSLPTAVNAAKVITDIKTRDAYLLTIMIKDKESVFISQINREVAAVLGVALKHAANKDSQTIGVKE